MCIRDSTKVRVITLFWENHPPNLRLHSTVHANDRRLASFGFERSLETPPSLVNDAFASSRYSKTNRQILGHPTIQRLAWVLSIFSSCVCGPCCLPYVWKYVFQEWDEVCFVAEQMRSSPLPFLLLRSSVSTLRRSSSSVLPSFLTPFFCSPKCSRTTK